MSQGLFTAVSGIRANQTKLNVIANNLANVNTVAFKSSTVNFKNVFAQTISAGTRPSTSIGGTNPKQIGNGVTVGEIPANFGQGGSLFTGKATDLLISGEGFFTIERIDPNLGSNNEGFFLTRAGNFSLDANGNLVTAGGNRVLGTRTVLGNDPTTIAPVNIPQKLTIWKEIDANQNVVQTWIGDEASTTVTTADLGNPANTLAEADVELISFSVGIDGAITAGYSNGDQITVTNDPGTANSREVFHITAEGFDFSPSGLGLANGTLNIADPILVPEQLQVRMATVPNPAGLIYEGNNYYSLSPNSGDPSFGIASVGNKGQIESGALESSNVDIATEFTSMIIAQRGLEASSKVVTVQSDVLRAIIQIV